MPVLGLSEEVYNFALALGFKKIRGSKVRKVKKLSDLLNKTDFFSELKLCRLVSFQSLGVGYTYIPLLKALKHIN